MAYVYIVLPAYNEEHSIAALLEAIEYDLKNYNQNTSVIVVNDGSTDRTGEIVDAHKNSLNVTQIKHPYNMGLGNAIKTGFSTLLDMSKNDDDIAIYMDSDNTHPPEYCIPMIEKMKEGWEIVIASRYKKGSKQIGVPLFRRFLSFGARVLFHFTLHIPGVRDYTCGFRAYNVGLLRRANTTFGSGLITRNGFACTDELLVNLSTLTNKITEIPFVLRYDRKKGKSKIHLFTTVIETIKMLIKKKN